MSDRSKFLKGVLYKSRVFGNCGVICYFECEIGRWRVAMTPLH
ncbi:hypothetical protein CKA32_004853 [Geitlerinema sp. FC II]|nr:hypothetical protein CKA32_004853 [Geitlerinema sp. FC II]